MITVIPTRRVRLSGSGIVLTVAIVAVLGAVYLAFAAPLGDEAFTQSASEPAAHHTRTTKESS
jgi:hypothetical protein